MSATFGPILRKVRKMAGLTQEEMAERMHMSRPNVSKIERGQIELRLSDAVRWCQVTNMPEIAAAMLCNIDPTILTQIIENLPTILRLVGAAFISPLLHIL